jgi:hypothetical protein
LVPPVVVGLGVAALIEAYNHLSGNYAEATRDARVNQYGRWTARGSGNGGYWDGSAVDNSYTVIAPLTPTRLPGKGAAKCPPKSSRLELWRAVDDAELQSIQSTGRFTQAPNGAEVKWFSGSQAEVEAWRKLPFNSGTNRSVVRASIDPKYAHNLGNLPGEGQVWTVHMDDFGHFGQIYPHP